MDILSLLTKMDPYLTREEQMALAGIVPLDDICMIETALDLAPEDLLEKWASNWKRQSKEEFKATTYKEMLTFSSFSIHTVDCETLNTSNAHGLLNTVVRKEAAMARVPANNLVSRLDYDAHEISSHNLYSFEELLHIIYSMRDFSLFDAGHGSGEGEWSYFVYGYKGANELSRLLFETYLEDASLELNAATEYDDFKELALNLYNRRGDVKLSRIDFIASAKSPCKASAGFSLFIQRLNKHKRCSFSLCICGDTESCVQMMQIFKGEEYEICTEE